MQHADSNRWSIYIDVEGFSALYERDSTRAIWALSTLMGALYRVGAKAFPAVPDRLFIHQFGDGFVIVSDFPEATAERPLAVAIAVMRHMIAKGVATKSAISSGDFSDIFGCYPSEVQEAADDHHHVRIGDGIMTIIPVMGSALISPYKLAAKKAGAVLLLDPTKFSATPCGLKLASGSLTIVDWIHSDFPMISEICGRAGLAPVTAEAAENCLRGYVHTNRGLSTDWVSSTLSSVGISS